MFIKIFFTYLIWAYYKTRNTRTRNSRTSGNSWGTTEHYPQHKQNTPEQRNHTKQRTIAVLLRENLKLKT